MSSKLAFQHVQFQYGEEPLLREFSFDVKQGEFVSLVGPSGIGKSTIFKLATGLIQPNHGEILLNGIVSRERLGKVAYMPQQDLLMPWRTVVMNAALPLEIQGVSKDMARERVVEQLPVFGLEKYADAYPHQLSGGMRQRVSLLRATLAGSEILLLDEPFSSLDGITRMEMQEWLLKLWQEIGSTVVMITHDLEEAILLSDRVIVLLDRPISSSVEIPILLERNKRSDMRNDPRFLSVREQIWRALRLATTTEYRQEEHA